MNIAIMGSGGLGGYFGARLAAAGHDVAFIARGVHLAALRSHGLSLKSDFGDLDVPAVVATDEPAGIGPVDIVVFTVKLYDMAAAAEAARPLVGNGTVVVPLLNGIDAPNVLSQVLGDAAAAGGVTRILSFIDAPGVIRQIGRFAEVIVGPLHDTQRERLGEFRDALQASGVQARVSDDIRAEIWKKMVLLAPLSAITTVTRRPCGVIQSAAELRDLFRCGVAEAVAVAQACDIDLPDTTVDDICAFARGLPAESPTSMQYDLEQGRRLELPWLSGALVRLGREHGVPTPMHAFIAAVLGPWVNGQPRP